MAQTKDLYKPLTPAMIAKLNDHKKRTGWGAVALVKRMKEKRIINSGVNISPHVLESWYAGNTKSVDPGIYDAVLRAYSEIPEELFHKTYKRRFPKNRVAADEALKNKIEALIKAYPNISVAKLLQLNHAPPTLTVNVISKIRTGKLKTVLNSHADFIETLYNALKSKRS